MKATGIVRCMDDLGRVVIPKAIRKAMNIKEGDPLEIFTEEKRIIFQKYVTLEDELSELSADWVKSNAKIIKFVSCTNGVTTCGFGSTSTIIGTVKHHPKDDFDLNVAICYCAKKAGYSVAHLN